MRTFITTKILPQIAKRGFVIQEVIAKEKMIGLLEHLYPMQTQFDLIRIGANRDGGYLVPDCLEEIDVCFSQGVARVSEFECLERGMKGYQTQFPNPLDFDNTSKPHFPLPKDWYKNS